MNNLKFNKISQVIHYITRENSGLTRPQLMKLVYLIDREFYKRYNRQITNSKYFMYFYGPYCNEYECGLNNLNMNNIIRKEPTGMTYKIYHNKKIQYSLNQEEKEIINLVLENAKKQDLLNSSKNMKEFIYSLKEVKTAKPLEDINFENID